MYTSFPPDISTSSHSILHPVLSVPCINTYVAAHQVEVMSQQSKVVVSEYQVEDSAL